MYSTSVQEITKIKYQSAENYLFELPVHRRGITG